MMQIANILPGQWQRYAINNYAVWVHRFARAVGKEIDRLPEKPPPLPWPVYQKPVNELRQVNERLFPKSGPQFAGKPKPSTRKYLNSYVPRVVEDSAARTEVYRGEDGDNFQLRIKKCWDHPRPWSIEAAVDPGSIFYLPFFREVTIRLPLKAKVCRELNATKDGRWVGACGSVKKLNAREPLREATRWLLDQGQAIRPPVDSGQWTVDSGGQKTTGSGPANSERLRANRCSPGLAAYQEKQAARDRQASQPQLRRRLPLEGALHVEGFYPPPDPWGTRYQPYVDFARQEREEAELDQAEMEIMAVMLQTAPELNDPFVKYTLPYLQRDDLDGYLVTQKEVGPDPHSFFLPEPRYRTMKWWRGYGRWGGKEKRYLTARERVAKVKPTIRIVPTGPRSAEVVITRRMHEVNIGLAEALNLARMIEAAIKYRNPKKPNRKLTWRQQLRSRLVNDAGRFIWLIRNPIDSMENGKWIIENDGSPTLNLGPVDPEVLRNLSFRPRPQLIHLFPEAGLPQHYLELIDRDWLTSDLKLFEATPGGDFATKVEGFPVRLPLAVMPPDAYERWLAKGTRRRRRKRRTRNRAGCSCSFRPPVFRAQPAPPKPKDAFFLRN